MQQVTDPGSLRKLQRRLEEPKLAQVKGYMDALLEQSNIISDMVYDTESLLKLPKVKENAHMTAVLQEIAEYLSNGNLDAAKKVVERIYAAKPTPVTLNQRGKVDGAPLQRGSDN